MAPIEKHSKRVFNFFTESNKIINESEFQRSTGLQINNVTLVSAEQKQMKEWAIEVQNNQQGLRSAVQDVYLLHRPSQVALCAEQYLPVESASVKLPRQMLDTGATFDCSSFPATYGPYMRPSEHFSIPFTLDSPNLSVQTSDFTSLGGCADITGLNMLDGGVGSSWELLISFANMTSKPASCSRFPTPSNQVVFYDPTKSSLQDGDATCTSEYNRYTSPHRNEITFLSLEGPYYSVGPNPEATVQVRYKYPLVEQYTTQVEAEEAMAFIFGAGPGTGWTIVQVDEFSGPSGSPWYNVTISRTGDFNVNAFIRVATTAQQYELEGAEIVAEDPIETIIYGSKPVPQIGDGTFECSNVPSQYGDFMDRSVQPTIGLTVTPATPWLGLNHIWSAGPATNPCWVPTELVSLDGGAGASWEIRTRFLHRSDPDASLDCFSANQYLLITYDDTDPQANGGSFDWMGPFCFTSYSEIEAPNTVKFNVTSAPSFHSGNGATLTVAAIFTHPLVADSLGMHMSHTFAALFGDSELAGHWTVDQVERDSLVNNTFHFTLSLAATTSVVDLIATPANVENTQLVDGSFSSVLLTLPYQSASGGGGADPNAGADFTIDGRASMDCNQLPPAFGRYNNVSAVYDVPVVLEPAYPLFSLNWVAETHNCFVIRDLVNVDGGVGKYWTLKVGLESAETRPFACSDADPSQTVYFKGPHASTSSAGNSPSCTLLYDSNLAQNTMGVSGATNLPYSYYNGTGTTVELLISFEYPLLAQVRSSEASTEAGQSPQSVFSGVVFANSTQVSMPVFTSYPGKPNTWLATFQISAGLDTIAFTAIPRTVENTNLRGGSYMAEVVFTLRPTDEALLQASGGGTTGGGTTGGGTTGGGTTGGGTTGGGTTGNSTTGGGTTGGGTTGGGTTGNSTTGGGTTGGGTTGNSTTGGGTTGGGTTGGGTTGGGTTGGGTTGGGTTGGGTGGGTTGGGTTGGGTTGGGTTGVGGGTGGPGSQNSTDSGTAGTASSASGGLVQANQATETDMSGGAVAGIVVAGAIVLGAALYTKHLHSTRAAERASAADGAKKPALQSGSDAFVQPVDSATAPAIHDGIEDLETCDKTENPMAKPVSPEQPDTVKVLKTDAGLDDEVRSLDFSAEPSPAGDSPQDLIGPDSAPVEGSSAQEVGELHGENLVQDAPDAPQPEDESLEDTPEAPDAAAIQQGESDTPQDSNEDEGKVEQESAVEAADAAEEILPQEASIPVDSPSQDADETQSSGPEQAESDGHEDSSQVQSAPVESAHIGDWE